MFHSSHLSTVETLPTLVVGVLRFRCLLGLFLGLGFGVFGFVFFFFGLFPLPIRRASILLMMTWVHRPHGVRTRGKNARSICQYGPELREALCVEEPIVLRGADQELRARRLFHLIQQAFTGYPKIEHMIRNQIMARGAADANGYELFRLIRCEFSIYSRQEALYCRELVLKFTVKKPSIDGLIDVLREIQTEIESFHSMLEASVMARALVDLRINEGDQFFAVFEEFA